MKALLLVAGAFFASSAFARQIVIPTLPVAPFADTEVSTNVVGVLVNGIGYGAATIKKVGSVPVTIFAR